MATSIALEHCLKTVDSAFRNEQVVIVPGGGAFAEQVRSAQQQWRFDDKTAHYMAILAMQQMALLIKALQPNWLILSHCAEIENNDTPVTIWSPLFSQLDRAGIAASWDITSDSLAAWLSSRLRSQKLILIKSADIAADVNIGTLQQQGILDPAFHHFIKSSTFSVQILNYQQFYYVFND